MSVLSMWRVKAAQVAPGLLISATVAAAASFLGTHYGAPVMLFALLIGMAFNFLYDDGPCRAGVDLASKFILRLGVGLLGVRIALDDLARIGVDGAMVLAGLVAATIASGFVIAPLLGRQWRFALITGGAVAICGASAALAIAAVIPPNDKTERNTLFTVMAVTALSTVAMVVYPVLFQALGFSEGQQGFLIGATIHDVAQVVGAGFSVSNAAGETATVVKLFRVAMLPVVLIVIALTLRLGPHGGAQGRIALLPWFMVLFLALVVLGSVVDLPLSAIDPVNTLSRTCLIVAIAALGIKTSLKALSTVGGGHLAVVVIETLVLLGLATLVIGMVDFV
ncbi:MAG: putative sulfate exporter family transporter [Pseudotabrizicola sp.]|uniref:YeiH family protein n=1 Tax=Pseudotabrizicola sp. TaxID=2939647 RepID=UPI0027317F0D|nr:putative sulfate exporter family transporter [Pseudotabrizicola sp.]MDP2083527.1 putative sulfate exporter family transporter [Pseudotabrizicola sp.]MDZ7575046.1 putative sulfate exporter family transporter [Pseudotabrizicola sp.]